MTYEFKNHRAASASRRHSSFRSANGAVHTSPGQRPGVRCIPVFQGLKARSIGKPGNGAGRWPSNGETNGGLGRFPRLVWSGPLALKTGEATGSYPTFRHLRSRIAVRHLILANIDPSGAPTARYIPARGNAPGVRYTPCRSRAEGSALPVQ